MKKSLLSALCTIPVFSVKYTDIYRLTVLIPPFFNRTRNHNIRFRSYSRRFMIFSYIFNTVFTFYIFFGETYVHGYTVTRIQRWLHKNLSTVIFYFSTRFPQQVKMNQNSKAKMTSNFHIYNFYNVMSDTR